MVAGSGTQQKEWHHTDEMKVGGQPAPGAACYRSRFPARVGVMASWWLRQIAPWHAYARNLQGSPLWPSHEQDLNKQSLEGIELNGPGIH